MNTPRLPAVNAMKDLHALLMETFPPLTAGDLAYLQRPTPSGLRPLAFRFTIQQVSLASCGCTGGVVAAVTGEFAAWLKPQYGEGPLPYGDWTETLRVEFESEAQLDDGDAWARGLRERISREHPGIVAGIQCSSALVVRADPDRTDRGNLTP